jgi:hypothetical protein
VFTIQKYSRCVSRSGQWLFQFAKKGEQSSSSCAAQRNNCPSKCNTLTYPISRPFLSDDALVWGFNSPFLWRITQEDVTSLYRANVSRNHCEIAVGTGLHLSKVIPLTRDITLIDLNENCLRVCEERIMSDHHDGKCNIAKPEVSKLVVDITEPLPPPPGEDAGNYSQLTPIRGRFQSVGVNFLFHCLHGSNLHDKVDSFRNCASLLDPEDGVFFGSTILGKEMLDDEDNAGETSIRTLRALNSIGVFGNLGDSLIDLDRILRDIFDDVDVRRVGYCGVWKAKHPRVRPTRSY